MKNIGQKILDILHLKSSPLFFAVILYLICQSITFNLFSGLLDEGFTLYNAQLISQGQIPYRDFFIMTTPGSYYILAFFFKIFGNYILAGRILGMISIIITLYFCNKLFQLKSYWQYIYLFSLSIIFSTPARFFMYNDAFSISIIALYFLSKGMEKDKTSFLYISGILSALCFIFKQSVGGLILPIYLTGIFLTSNKNGFQKATAYIGGVLTLLAPITFYFLIENAFPQAIYHIFSFAGSAKGYQLPFLAHRLLLIPIIIILIEIFKRYRLHIKLLTFSLLLFAATIYLISEPNRIGRLTSYLSDIMFYIQSLVFIFIIFTLILFIKKAKKYQKFTLISLSMLAIFLSAAASGYVSGSVAAIAPLFIPLLIELSKKYKGKIATFGIIGIIAIYVALFLFNPFGSSGNYLTRNYTAYISVPEAIGIRFTPQQTKDLEEIVSYIKSHTDKNEKIFCFPYCPGLYFLSERNGGSYYSLFWFETFMEKDQDKVISDLRRNNVRLVILQKTGSIEERKQLEEQRLSKIRNFLTTNFHKTLNMPNFIVLEN